MNEENQNLHKKDETSVGFRTALYFQLPKIDDKIKEISEGVENLKMNSNFITPTLTPRNSEPKTFEFYKDYISTDLLRRLEESSPKKNSIASFNKEISEVFLKNSKNEENENINDNAENQNQEGDRNNSKNASPQMNFDENALDLKNFTQKNKNYLLKNSIIFESNLSLSRENSACNYQERAEHSMIPMMLKINKMDSPKQKSAMYTDSKPSPIYNYYNESSEYFSQFLTSNFYNNKNVVEKKKNNNQDLFENQGFEVFESFNNEESYYYNQIEYNKINRTELIDDNNINNFNSNCYLGNIPNLESNGFSRFNNESEGFKFEIYKNNDLRNNNRKGDFISGSSFQTVKPSTNQIQNGNINYFNSQYIQNDFANLNSTDNLVSVPNQFKENNMRKKNEFIGIHHDHFLKSPQLNQTDNMGVDGRINHNKSINDHFNQNLNNPLFDRFNNFNNNNEQLKNQFWQKNFGDNINPNLMNANNSTMNSVNCKTIKPTNCYSKCDNDEYTVEMFGKRGWICDACNNFNYETRAKCNRCQIPKIAKKIGGKKNRFPMTRNENNSDKQKDLQNQIASKTISYNVQVHSANKISETNNDNNYQNIDFMSYNSNVVQNKSNCSSTTNSTNNNTVIDNNSDSNIPNLTNNFNDKKVKRPFAERVGDWKCYKCNNLNFSFRIVCNRCQMSKSESNSLAKQSMRNYSNMIKLNEMMQFNILMNHPFNFIPKNAFIGVNNQELDINLNQQRSNPFI